MAASGGSNANLNNFSQENAMLLDLAGKTLMHSSGSAARVLLPGFSTTMQMLRPYFAVDNRFVMKKIKRILFPFPYKSWRRQVSV
jgi:hypothetical protein